MEIESYDKERAAFFEEFEKLRPDLMFPEAWTDDQRQEAAHLVRPNSVKSGMLGRIPMRCAGRECPFAPSCPLLKKDIAPVGKPCPIEMSAVMQFFNDYVEELGVDVTRMVEVSMVRDLVDQEIQQMRKTWILSQEHFIQENVAGMDAEGNVVTRKELHMAVDYEDRILRRKEKLRQQLLATRESKAKAGHGAMDASQAVADVMERVRQAEIEREKLVRQKLGIESYDEYVEDAEIVDDEES